MFTTNPFFAQLHVAGSDVFFWQIKVVVFFVGQGY